MLLGTCIVYVSMAACSATDDIQLSSGTAGGASGTSGMGGMANTSGMGGMIGMGGMANTSGMGGMANTSGMGGAGGVGGFVEDDGGIFDALTDPVPDASADPTSGTRLKAKYMKADDGARAPIAGVWHDSQRNEECSFQRAADGKQRCMPTNVTYAGFYADASCTQPFLYVTTGCAPTKYVVDYGQTCGALNTLNYFPVGSQTVPATIYYKTGGNCMSSPAISGYDYYTAGAKISPSSFVGGAVEIDP